MRDVPLSLHCFYKQETSLVIISLSSQVYFIGYLWNTAGGNPAVNWHPFRRGGGGTEILTVASCDNNWDTLLPCLPVACVHLFPLSDRRLENLIYLGKLFL